MTKFDFLTSVATSDLSDDIKAFASAELAKYKASKEFQAAVRRATIQAAAVEYLKAHGATKVVDLASAIGLSTHLTLASACKPLVDDGVIKKETRLVGDKTATFYSLAE